MLTKTAGKWPTIVVGAISAKLMLTSSATKHVESRVTSIMIFLLYTNLLYSYNSFGRSHQIEEAVPLLSEV